MKCNRPRGKGSLLQAEKMLFCLITKSVCIQSAILPQVNKRNGIHRYRFLRHVHTCSRVHQSCTPPTVPLWCACIMSQSLTYSQPHYLSSTPQCVWGKDMWILHRKWDSLNRGNFMRLAYWTGKREFPSRGWGRGRTAGREKDRHVNVCSPRQRQCQIYHWALSNKFKLF